MDPQATWDQLLCAYADGDWDAIEECANELLEWLGRGGFPPKVCNQPGLGPDLNRALAHAGCLFALEAVSGQWATTASTVTATTHPNANDPISNKETCDECDC